MKKIVLLASLLVCSFYSYSQNNIRLDSLNKEFDRVDVLFDSLLHIYYTDTTMTRAEDSAMRLVIDSIREESKKLERYPNRTYLAGSIFSGRFTVSI